MRDEAVSARELHDATAAESSPCAPRDLPRFEQLFSGETMRLAEHASHAMKQRVVREARQIPRRQTRTTRMGITHDAERSAPEAATDSPRRRYVKRPSWMMKLPRTMTARPIHVETGTTSAKTRRPKRTLTTAKNATYVPRSFEKSIGNRFTTTP